MTMCSLPAAASSNGDYATVLFVRGSADEHKCTLKYERDESTGQTVHLYEALDDDPDCVMLEVRGVASGNSVDFAPSGRPLTRMNVKITRRFASALGLIGPAEDTESNKKSGLRTGKVIVRERDDCDWGGGSRL